MNFQDLDLGETVSPEAKLKASEAEGKVPACASQADRSLEGRTLGKSSAEGLEANKNAINLVSNYGKGLLRKKRG